MKVRLGLIGAGPWGRAYIRTILGLDGVVLARLASKNPSAVQWAGPDCAVTSDWREVARARDLHGVIIATPPQLHFEMARTAVQAGVPALVEKPLTMDVGQARSLLDLAEQRRALVWVDHLYLFHPAYDMLKKRARRLGPVRAIRSAGGNWGPFRAGVPALWDYGPHDVALCMDLLASNPVSVKAELEKSLCTSEGPGENVKIRLDFAGNTAAEISVGNLMSEKKRRFEVLFDDEALVMDDLSASPLTIHRRQGGALDAGDIVAVDPALPLTRAVGAFAAAAESGSTDLSGIRLGTGVVEVLSSCEAELRSRG